MGIDRRGAKNIDTKGAADALGAMLSGEMGVKGLTAALCLMCELREDLREREQHHRITMVKELLDGDRHAAANQERLWVGAKNLGAFLDEMPEALANLAKEKEAKSQTRPLTRWERVRTWARNAFILRPEAELPEKSEPSVVVNLVDAPVAGNG